MYQVEWRTLRDDDLGVVGIAIRVHDGIDRPWWLWGSELQRASDLPSLPCFLKQCIFHQPVNDGIIAAKLAALQKAGVINIGERVRMLNDLGGVAWEIMQEWNR